MKQQSWLLILAILSVPSIALAQADATVLAGFTDDLNTLFSTMVNAMSQVLFFKLGGVPLLVLWLIGGAVFFTLRMGFINFRAFSHAIYVLLGHYDDPGKEGEVTHFQAMSAALSATVGLGNIAGVAVAIQLGGPGVVLWMTIAGLFGMTSKFVECTLAQKYRLVRADGHVSGGPMYYLSRGLAEQGWRPLGKILAVLFSILCLGGTLGGGNMFQANQSYAAVSDVFGGLQNWVYGLMIAALVGVVIIGGIRRIAAVAAALVPAMGIIYAGAAVWIMLTHLTAIPGAVAEIFTGFWSPKAVISGGVIGVLVQGFQRSAFSNEAGLGSAAIAHAAARTDEPVRAGIVALLEPFIDTVVICNLTALAIIVTGTYLPYQGGDATGVTITVAAFATVIDWFPVILALATFLFAFSTIISWSYYGEQSWQYLFGSRTILLYRLIFVAFVFIGAVVKLQPIINFSDMMLLGMAFPNMLGGFLLSSKVATDLKNYMARLKGGEMMVYR